MRGTRSGHDGDRGEAFELVAFELVEKGLEEPGVAGLVGGAGHHECLGTEHDGLELFDVGVAPLEQLPAEICEVDDQHVIGCAGESRELAADEICDHPCAR